MDDRTQIAEIERRIMAAFAAGDADAVAAQYTEDALLLPPGSPPLGGRAVIAETYRATFADFTVQLRNEVEETEIAGDWAWVRGRFDHTTTAKADGTATKGSGKYLAIARRDSDGVWRFHRDAFNSDEA